MSSRYAIKGRTSGEALSYHGRILVHDNRHELEWIFPHEQVIPYDGTLPTMRWADHPDMAAVTWPIRREDFR